MTLAASGVLSMGGTTETRSINLELYRSATSTIDLNDSEARYLANVFSGNISMSDFYNKTYFIFGQEEFTSPGTYDWTCPAEVTSVSVLCIGAGGGGDAGSDLIGVGGGGGGGALAFRNNIPVVPGQTYSVVVGAAGSGQITTGGSTVQESTDGESSNAFSCIAGGGKRGTRTTVGVGISSQNAAGGSTAGIFTGGFAGGTGGTVDTSNLGFRGPGGGGAAGYAGIGGAGARGQRSSGTPTSAAGFSGAAGAGGGAGGGGSGFSSDVVRIATGALGGGVGLYGQGTSGAGGTAGSASTPAQSGGDGSEGSAGFYGAGGAGGVGTADNRFALDGITGAVRIIWPGIIRRYPTTQTQNA